MTEHYEAQIKGYKERELKVPDWITVSLKEQKQALRKAEREKSKVEDKLSSLGIRTDDDMMKYVRSLNVQKHACKEKIRHAEETLPETIAKLRAELHKQKAAEYPVEKQREVLESDILNNLRPMSEVAYEVKTVRFESMLAAKLDAGDITREEHDEYKKAGFEQYEKWQNGEIASLSETVPHTESDRHLSVAAGTLPEKHFERAGVFNTESKKIEYTEGNFPAEKIFRHEIIELNKKTTARKKKDTVSLSIYEDSGGLFFGMNDDVTLPQQTSPEEENRLPAHAVQSAEIQGNKMTPPEKVMRPKPHPRKAAGMEY